MEFKKFLNKAKKEVPLIILSFLFAVSLWYFNQLQYTQERSFQLEPTLQISDKMLPIRPPKAVTVTVRGPSEQLQNIDPKEFLLTVDLKGVITEGEYNGNIVVTRTGVARHLKGIEVSYSPISIPITLERKVSKPVKVKVITQGAVKTGYELEIGVPAPDFVMVTGPRSMMEKLEFIETEPVDLEKLTGTLPEDKQNFMLDKSVMLSPPFDGTTSIIYNRDIEILYSCRIRETLKQITVKDLYINQIGTNDQFNYKLSEEYVRLNLSGPELKLNRLDVSKLVVGIELYDINAPGEYEIPVVRMFDSKTKENLKGITDLGLNPPTVKVVVEAK